MTIPVNSYGDCDIRQGIPEGFVHIPERYASIEAEKLGIEYADAFDGFNKKSRPVHRGVVVTAADAPRLLEIIIPQRKAAEERREKEWRARESAQKWEQKRVAEEWAEARAIDPDVDRQVRIHSVSFGIPPKRLPKIKARGSYDLILNVKDDKGLRLDRSNPDHVKYVQTWLKQAEFELGRTHDD